MENLGLYAPTIIGLTALFYLALSAIHVRRQKRHTINGFSDKVAPPLPFDEA